VNLLKDPWIRVRRGSGQVDTIAPVQLTSDSGSSAVEILAPRADFRGALYQFLIGLLQTALAPQSLREWQKLWEVPPGAAALQEAFSPYAHAFEFDTEGPAFMQDFDLPQSEPVGISALLIDAPGEKTISDNKDHFVHRGGVRQVCYDCAATALFTLQINAPSGGAGHRVSVRGGGPLTTLLLPEDPQTSLWRKIWLNILPIDALNYPETTHLADVLPWVAPARASGPGGAGDTTPEAVHPLQAYWSVPRRIRLHFEPTAAGVCDLCGDQAQKLVQRYTTRNYGVNYTGAWLHPLTPYNYDPEGKKPPLSIKGQRGGIGYRHWLGLTLGNEDRMPDAASVVHHHQQRMERLAESDRHVRLWCFGYDLDNMKARCWYDTVLPVYLFAEVERTDRFMRATAHLLRVAEESARLLHSCVKQAWFTRPGDAGSEPAIPQSFWQRSEAAFYQVLGNMAQLELAEDEDRDLIPIYKQWLKEVSKVTIELFDQWVLAAPIEGMDISRVVRARTDLLRMLYRGKTASALRRVVEAFEEVTV
jgi:CRISPR system Cascade subunit CasA